MSNPSPFSRLRPRTLTLMISGLCAAAPLFAHAAEDASEEKILPTVETVSAIRASGILETSPLSVSVVDQRALTEQAGTGGIQQALESLPGVEFARSGGLGGQIVMRGFNSNQSRSILTIDGDRYHGRSTLEFNMFDPNAIERVEVIRGAASALYGADAMNGVVNIVTRRAKVGRDDAFRLTPHLRALEYGSVNHMRGARVELEGGGAGFDVLVGVSDRRAGDFDTPEGHAKNSGFTSTQLDFNLGYRPTEESRWELSGRYADVSTERAGGLGAAPGAPLQEVKEDPIVERYLRLGYQGRNFGGLAGQLADTLDVALYRRDFKTDIYQVNRSNPAVTAMPHLKVYSPTVWGGHLTAMKGIGEHLLSYGADFFREDFDGRKRQITRKNPTTGALIGQTPWQQIDRDSVQTNIGVFVSDEWAASEDWTLSGALRYDRVTVKVGKTAATDEGAAQSAEFATHRHNRDGAVTGSIGAVYKLTPIWSLAANFGRGFRAPSGNERVITSVAGTLVSLPAPGLKPEYNKTLEVGLRWNAAHHRGSVTAYESRYTDLIASVVVSPVLRQRQNIADATIRGLELEGQSQLALRWKLNYTLAATHGEDESAHEPLPYISPLTARLALRFEPHGANSHYVEGVWRGYKGKHRIDRTQERKTASYALFDVYGGVKLDGVFGASWRGWKLIAGVENLFDRKGQNPAISEDIAFARSYTNPLIEPGRNLIVKLSSDY
ncbi:hypothetical protein AGMMS49545_00970 [Betaproteobacteria bacterium]|nr:hypothetical protein AGMMS49545_00970 [Betaproteobacteria bacterium]